MNQYNCIEITSDLNQLENDFNNWLQLPYDLRKRSDEYCQLYYGCTNIDLYNNLKALIIRDSEEDISPIKLESFIRENKHIYNNLKLLNEAKININKDQNNQNSVETMPIGYTDDGKVNSILDKIKLSKEIMNYKPNVVIIYNFVSDDSLDYDMSFLNNQKQKYAALSIDNKKESDSYSIKIWSKSVLFMYEYMKNKIEKIQNKDIDNDETPVSKIIKISDTDKRLNNYWDKIEFDQNSGNIVETSIDKIDCLSKSSNRTLYESAVLEGFFNKIEVNGKTYQQGMPEIVPFLTYDEYVNDPDGMNSAKLDKVDPFSYVFNYIDNQKEALGELKEAWKNNDKNKLLEMGWNPYVSPTPQNIKYAKNKQINWLNEFFGFDLINISNYTTNLSEEVLDKSLFNLDENQKLYPIYIVSILNQTDINGGIETSYINPGISFNTELYDIFTFNDDNSLKRENINEYCGFTEDTKFGLFVCFVNKNFRDIIEDGVLKNYSQRIPSYNYKKFTSTELTTNPQLIFGQFINKIFNLSGYNFNDINISDIVDIKRSTVKYNIFMIFKGTLSSYYPRVMMLKVKNLIAKNGYNSLTFFKPETVMDSLNVKLLENFNIKTSDNKINSLLTQLREDVKPRDMFNSMPKVTTVTDLYNDYLDQHTVLKNSSTSNIDEIKRAVEKLYGIKSKAEAKAKFVNKESATIKTLSFIIENAKQDCFTYEKIFK